MKNVMKLLAGVAWIAVLFAVFQFGNNLYAQCDGGWLFSITFLLGSIVVLQMKSDNT